MNSMSTNTLMTDSITTNVTPKKQKFPMEVDNFLWLYISPWIALMGLVGNGLVLAVMMRRKDSSTRVYLAWLAIFDTLALLSGTIPEFINALRLPLFNTLSTTTCQIEKFFFYTTSDTAIWILVAFTLDRFVAVCFPLRKRSFCVPKRSKVTCFVIFLLAIFKNLHVFWTRAVNYEVDVDLLEFFLHPQTSAIFQVSANNTTSFQKPPMRYKCGRAAKFTFFEKHVRPWIVFALISALPFILIIFSNALIIWTLEKSKKQKLSTSQHQSRPTNNVSHTTSHTAALPFEANSNFVSLKSSDLKLTLSENKSKNKVNKFLSKSRLPFSLNQNPKKHNDGENVNGSKIFANEIKNSNFNNGLNETKNEIDVNIKNKDNLENDTMNEKYSNKPTSKGLGDSIKDPHNKPKNVSNPSSSPNQKISPNSLHLSKHPLSYVSNLTNPKQKQPPIRNKSTTTASSYKHTVMMCLGVSIAFLICVLPSIVMLIGKPYWFRKPDGSENDLYEIFKAINNQLAILNHSINFFMYCLTGSRFRSELIEMVKTWMSAKFCCC